MNSNRIEAENPLFGLALFSYHFPHLHSRTVRLFSKEITASKKSQPNRPARKFPPRKHNSRHQLHSRLVSVSRLKQSLQAIIIAKLKPAEAQHHMLEREYGAH